MRTPINNYNNVIPMNQGVNTITAPVLLQQPLAAKEGGLIGLAIGGTTGSNPTVNNPMAGYSPEANYILGKQVDLTPTNYNVPTIKYDNIAFNPNEALRLIQATADIGTRKMAGGGSLPDEIRMRGKTFKYFDPAAVGNSLFSNSPMPMGRAEGGEVQEHNPEFFSEGGLGSMENRYVKGQGDGTSDSIPAMLANGEFVIPADVVSSLGNGSNDSGAAVLDEFLKTIRQHKTKAGKKGLPPDSKGALGYLLEAKRKVRA